VSFDNVCKILAEKYPLDFARWLLPEAPQTVKVLKTELGIEPIRADFVTFLRTENRILHIEFQTRTTSKTPIPLRMLDYCVRLKRLYGVNVTQVVIFLQETDDEIAFTQEYVDETTTHRYRVIRMWEQDSDLFLNHPPLLPLAPLTRTNTPQGLLSQVSENLAKIADRETKQDIAAYTEILAGLKFEKDLIRQFLREDIMQESVIYQDILQKGERIGQKRGEKIGEEIGQKIGQKLGEERLVIRQINRKLGDLQPALIERIKLLSTEELENLGEALLDFSDVSDLVVWLNQEDK
jgi:predicted transposase YdaD